VAKALADGLSLAGLRPVSIAQGAGTQVGVQFGPVVDLGHGRGPVALQEADAAFDARLLLGPPNQAEQRLEQVVTGQGLIAVMELPIAADKDVRRNGLGIVPPEFMRHATKEGESLGQAVQDGFGALTRQGDGEGAVRVAPGDQQHGNELAARREIDVDVAEVGFETLAGIVGERDEGLGRPRRLRTDIEADAFGTAGVAVLVAEAAKDLGGRVPLLPRCLLIGAEDVVDEGLEWIEDGGRGRPLTIGLGLGLAEDLANLTAGMMEAACQLADAQLLDRVCPADTCELVHLDHPSPPCSWTSKWCTSLQEAGWGWARFRRGDCLAVGPNWTRVSTWPRAAG
jgi:hypothetical protein